MITFQAAGANRIELDVPNPRYFEALASGIAKPGHLLMLDSNRKVLKHNQNGGKTPLFFGREHCLEGNPVSVMDAWAVGDHIGYVLACPGDVIAARVAPLAQAIVVGNFLASNGDGTVRKVEANNRLLATLYTASTAVSNSVSTEQDYDATLTVPAGTLRTGDVLRITGHIIVSAAASTDTITVKVYFGATAVLVSAAVNSTTADVISFDVTIIVRDADSSGGFIAYGTINNGAVSVAADVGYGAVATGINMTTAKVIKASSTWSATSATCTSALQAMTVTLDRLYGDNALLLAVEAVDNSGESEDEALIAAMAL